MPSLSFRTYRYYLPPLPLTLQHESMDTIFTNTYDIMQQLKLYAVFCLKCIGIFFLLNGSHYITKYVENSNPTFYDQYHIGNIRSMQLFVAWGLFTALWNIFLSYNINISNNKRKYKTIIMNTSSETNDKLEYLKHSRCNLIKTWHICIIVFIHDCIAYISLQYTSISQSIISFVSINLNASSSIGDLIHDVLGFCYVFLFSSLTLMIFDFACCNKISSKKHVENSLSAPLVSDIDMVDVKEIIHVHPSYPNQRESPLVYSTLPSTKDSNQTPIPSSYKNVTYLGNSDTIDNSCINVWCLNIFQALAFLLFFVGIEFIGDWQKEFINAHFEKWMLALLTYTSIWRYIMTRIGRMYDGLRIFSFSDRNSELTEALMNDTDENTTKYFMSIELILYVFVMSVYFNMMNVYMIYYEPSWRSFCVALMFHIGSELFENGVRASTFYYNLTNNLYFVLSMRCYKDVFVGRVIGLFRDESNLRLWKERVAIDISIKMVILLLSYLAAVLLTICEYVGHLNMNNAEFTSHRFAVSVLRVSITVISELILFICMHYLWYHGKGFLFEPFTRIITGIWGKKTFIWMFMSTFIIAGLTFGGKNI